MIDFDGILAIIKMQTTKTRQRTLKTVRDGAQRRKQPMLAEERFGQILDLLNKQRTATVQELCEALGTSESTIRRDLTELDLSLIHI